jgi:hypothetical protein
MAPLTNSCGEPKVFNACEPPPVIDEIWMGQNSLDDWGQEEWLIEKVFGGGLELPDPVRSKYSNVLKP